MDICVAFIGGIDPYSISGIETDARVAERWKLTHCVIPSAITYQTPTAFYEYQSVPPQSFSELLRLLPDSVQVIKVGMIWEPAHWQILRNWLQNRKKHVRLVIDPVLKTSSGFSPPSTKTIISEIIATLPFATIITPNYNELLALTQSTGYSSADEYLLARALLKTGVKAILVKGGHSPHYKSDIVDLLIIPGRKPVPVTHQRLKGLFRGTGTLTASAIACALCMAADIEKAVYIALDWVYTAISQVYKSRNKLSEPLPATLPPLPDPLLRNPSYP